MESRHSELLAVPARAVFEWIMSETTMSETTMSETTMSETTTRKTSKEQLRPTPAQKQALDEVL
jgi:hypothetical protein